MSTARATVLVGGLASAAEACWYDPERWPRFVDGLQAANRGGGSIQTLAGAIDEVENVGAERLGRVRRPLGRAGSAVRRVHAALDRRQSRAPAVSGQASHRDQRKTEAKRAL